MKVIFEKFAAFVFLLLLIALIAFLTYIPVPPESKQLISAIIGGLMVTAAQALPNLFGDTDLEKERLIAENVSLRNDNNIKQAKIDLLNEDNHRVIGELIDHHVIADEQGILKGKHPKPVDS